MFSWFLSHKNLVTAPKNLKKMIKMHYCHHIFRPWGDPFYEQTFITLCHLYSWTSIIIYYYFFTPVSIFSYAMCYLFVMRIHVEYSIVLFAIINVSVYCVGNGKCPKTKQWRAPMALVLNLKRHIIQLESCFTNIHR